MIAAHSLTRKFGKFIAVDSVQFQIKAGRVVGFLGPNGAGKTTTIRMIIGHLQPTSGTVTVDGLDIRTDGLEIRRRLGYLPETTPLYTEMRVSEFLRFRATLFGIRGAARRAAIDRAIERCWLDDVRRKPIHQLSRGYRQRVGLAAALLHDPPVLILDEPTVGLDPSQIREVRGLIRELAGDHTILLSTHILPEVELTCDELILIARGRIRAAGTLESLRSGDDGLIVEVRDAGMAQRLQQMKGIRNVNDQKLADGWHRLTLQARGAATDLAESVGAALAEAGATVRLMQPSADSLEQQFIRMVADAEVEYAERAEVAHAETAS